MHRKLLYSVLVLVLSAVLAASAFAQETTDQESETADINREVVVDEPSSDSSTDSAEDPSTPPPASDSIFASMPDDICPAVLDPFIVESFRDAAPALLERCETLPSEAPISDQIPVTEYQGEVPML